MRKATQIVDFTGLIEDPFLASSPPIYQTATFDLGNDAKDAKYDYTRSGNPTRDVLQKQVARLENGKYGFAFTTGMAAINAIVGILKPGDHILASDDLYGGTERLLNARLLEYRGIGTTFVDFTDITKFREAFLKNTKLVIFETPSNPLQKIADIAVISEISHSNNAIVALDNSFMSPLLQQPLDLGVDVVIHSATKYLAGHADVSGGVLVVNNENLKDQIAFIQNAEGSAIAPFDAWLILRGIKTLRIRLQEQERNALEIIEFLKTQKLITKIYYPTLKEHHNSDIHRKQAHGGGGVICFRTENSIHPEQIVKNLEVFKYAVSFGSVNSTINIPVNTSHLSRKVDSRATIQDLVRLSVGIEDINDLIDDLKNTFTKLYCRK